MTNPSLMYTHSMINPIERVSAEREQVVTDDWKRINWIAETIEMLNTIRRTVGAGESTAVETTIPTAQGTSVSENAVSTAKTVVAGIKKIVRETNIIPAATADQSASSLAVSKSTDDCSEASGTTTTAERPSKHSKPFNRDGTQVASATDTITKTGVVQASNAMHQATADTHISMRCLSDSVAQTRDETASTGSNK